jgi:hypothetical protein
VRSVPEAIVSLPVWVLLTTFAVAPLAAQADNRSAPRDRATDAEVGRAIETVKADPNLSATRTIKTLHWKNPAAPQPTNQPAWIAWIIGLFRWFDQGARVAVWCVAALAAGGLGVFIYRMVRTHGARRAADGFVAPTHVQDLDIRPESLPADIGSAARALWDRGEHRAALALLYRGLLSRLAHVYRVPVRDSTTEGDCLALAATHLDGRRHSYALQLVRVWQRTVYAHQAADTPLVYDLCDGFAMLDAPAIEARA